MRNNCVGHAFRSNEAGQRTGVDTAQSDYSARFQPFVQVPCGPIARGLRNGCMQHDAPGSGSCGHVEGLDVFLVRADISDMRKSERNDLAGIGGIRKDLLVARHRCVEADLPDRVPGGTEAGAFDNRSVRQNQQCGDLRLGPTCQALVTSRTAARLP